MDDRNVSASGSSQRLTDADYVDYSENVGPRGARHAFLEILKSHLDLPDHPFGNALTFAYGVVGGPWKLEWLGPSYYEEREAETRDALRDAMGEASAQLAGFAPAGFHQDAGAGFQCVHWSQRHAEVRLYEREPVAIGLKTVTGEAFSPFWFEEIIEGTLRVAAVALARLHPELRIVGNYWRLVNKRDMLLRLTDGPNGPIDFMPEDGAEDIGYCSHVAPIERLFADVATFAKSEREQFRNTLLTRYRVRKQDE